MGEAKIKAAQKLSRNATNEEIFPGFTHAPVQQQLLGAMTMTIDALRKMFPGYDITLFLAEKKALGRPPRFNYMSSASREDMTAVLRAFVAKNSDHAATLDKIEDAPPTTSKQ